MFQNITYAIKGHINNIYIYPGTKKIRGYIKTHKNINIPWCSKTSETIGHKQHQYTLVFQHITEAIGGHTNNINIYPGVPKHQRNYRTHKQHQYTLVFQNITEAIGGHTNNINIYPGVPKHQRNYRTHKQHQHTQVFQNITEAIGHIKQHQYTLVFQNISETIGHINNINIPWCSKTSQRL